MKPLRKKIAFQIVVAVRRCRIIALATALLLPLCAQPFISRSHAADALIQAANRKVTGDLPALKARRVIRALVNYSRSNFFYEDGHARGFEYELMKAYETFLNRKVKRKKDWTQVVFIPVRFDQLISGLVEGRGDIAAAGLTITDDRQKQVDFTNPYIADISEVVVAGPSVSAIASLSDLKGRTVFVRRASSYVEHLKAFNKEHAGWFSSGIHIRELDPFLVTEDYLEMANAGLIDLTIADGHIARAWSRVLPDIVVREDLAINRGGAVAWAVRKDSPELLKSLNAFIGKNKKGSHLGNIIFNRYYENSRWIKNAVAGIEHRKLTQLVPLFRKYGDKYGFDPLILAALAYQESGFSNKKKSPQGAVGIMQVLPSTAADKNINVKAVSKLENNIHAGTKYLDFLRQRYFTEPDIAPTDRVFFSLASYNAGPARISQMRRLAAERELDPNRWFFNVEVIAAEKIGRETVTYVTNITKFYIAYRLQVDMQTARMKAKESLLDEKR
ncbi:MAG: lytic transglycosylase F [Pseudomonadota bacterium]